MCWFGLNSLSDRMFFKAFCKFKEENSRLDNEAHSLHFQKL